MRAARTTRAPRTSAAKKSARQFPQQKRITGDGCGVFFGCGVRAEFTHSLPARRPGAPAAKQHPQQKTGSASVVVALRAAAATTAAAAAVAACYLPTTTAVDGINPALPIIRNIPLCKPGAAVNRKPPGCYALHSRPQSSIELHLQQGHGRQKKRCRNPQVGYNEFCGGINTV